MKKKALALVLAILTTLQFSIGSSALMTVSVEGAEEHAELADCELMTDTAYTPSDSYKNSKYYTGLQNVTLTGNQATDIVNVALSQVGYRNGSCFADLDGSNQTSTDNYTEYGYWFGTQVKGLTYGWYYDWCAMFVSWCARQAGIPTSVISNSAYACPGTSIYTFNNLTYTERAQANPIIGDLIFYDWVSNGTSWDHVGIVCSVTGNTVSVVEGNSDGTVKIIERDKDYSEIRGYGRPNYTPAGNPLSTTKTQSEAVEWAKNRVNGAALDADGAYGPQCVDFVQEYYRYLGVIGQSQNVLGNGCDYSGNYLPSGFSRISYYSGFVPSPGDVAVWSVCGGNTNGHVAVVTGANSSNFTVSDVYGSEAGTANQKVHSSTYSYSRTSSNYFWGVIRPNFANSSITYATVAEGEYRIKNSNGNYLTAPNDTNNSAITAVGSNGANSQKYNVVKVGSSYSIKSLNSSTSRVVNVNTSTSSANGNGVTLYNYTGDGSQLWKFEEKSGYYLIHPADNTSLSITAQSDGSVKVQSTTEAGNQLWTLETKTAYTISYNANGGSGAPSAQTKTSGTNITLSTTQPSRSGYTFQGWSTSSTASSPSYYAGSTFSTDANTTLYAVWSSAQGISGWGSWSDWSTSAVSENAYRNVETKTQYGYFHYALYFSDGGYGVYPVNLSTFNSIPGLGPAVREEYHTLWSDSVLERAKTSSGVVYDWTDGKGNSWHSYVNTHCSPQYNSALYELGTRIVYRYRNANFTVSYNANGGSGVPSSQTKTYGSGLTLSNVQPTRSGYTFKNWNTKADGTGTSYSPGTSFGVDSETTLYAQWTPLTYTVSFNANGGTGELGSQTKTQDVNLTLSDAIPSRTGFSFAGWATSAGGSSAYSRGSVYSSNSSVTLYAVWVPNIPGKPLIFGSDITVAEDDDVAFSWEATSYTDCYEIRFNKADGSSYFDEWEWTSTEYSKRLPAGSYTVNVVSENKSLKGTEVCYYVYSDPVNITVLPKYYTVSFDANNGTSAPTAQQKRYNQSLTLTFLTPTKTNHTFKGWSTTADGEATYQPGSAYTTDADVTLYAIWEYSGIAVTDVTLNKSATTLTVGSTETLTAAVAPTNATNKTVTWKSSDTSVATVENGIVTAVAAGSATITVTTTDGSKTATCAVTVKSKAVDPNAPQVKVSSAKCTAGKTISLTVELANNPGFVNLGIEVSYDSSVLTLTGVSNNTGVGCTYTPAQTLGTNPYNMGWDSTADITFNGTLATLTFAVADNVADGTYPVRVSFYRGKNGNYVDGDSVNYDEDFNSLDLCYVDGEVTVISYIPGDINGDGVVTNKDGTYLLRYLAGWEISDICEEALDVDGDGNVTNKDGTILLRYLAGWDIELH